MAETADKQQKEIKELSKKKEAVMECDRTRGVHLAKTTPKDSSQA